MQRGAMVRQDSLKDGGGGGGGGFDMITVDIDYCAYRYVNNYPPCLPFALAFASL